MNAAARNQPIPQVRLLTAALAVAAFSAALHVFALGGANLNGLIDLDDFGYGDPGHGHTGAATLVGESGISFGSFYRVAASLQSIGVTTHGLLALQLLLHLVVVAAFVRGARDLLPPDLHAASAFALAAAPEPILLVGENNNVLLIVAPLLFVAWRRARRRPNVASHALAGLAFALGLHIHFITLLILPLLYLELLAGADHARLRHTAVFTAAWLVPGLLPAAYGGLAAAAGLASYSGEMISGATHTRWAAVAVIALSYHAVALVGVGAAIRDRTWRGNVVVRDALAWFAVTILPSVLHSRYEAFDPRRLAVAAGPRAILVGAGVVLLARILSRSAAPRIAWGASLAAGYLSINMMAVFIDYTSADARTIGDRLHTLDMSPQVQKVLDVARVMRGAHPDEPLVFAGAEAGTLNAIRRWNLGEPRLAHPPTIFVAVVVPPPGTAGGVPARAATLWPIEMPLPVAPVPTDTGRAVYAVALPQHVPGDYRLVAIEARGADPADFTVLGTRDASLEACAPCLASRHARALRPFLSDLALLDNERYAQALISLSHGQVALIHTGLNSAPVGAWLIRSPDATPRGASPSRDVRDL
ncbi:hypothetical protein K8I61_13800 [bacterium]|nr:hypothetical protein [bacterium]